MPTHREVELRIREVEQYWIDSYKMATAMLALFQPIVAERDALRAENVEMGKTEDVLLRRCDESRDTIAALRSKLAEAEADLSAARANAEQWKEIVDRQDKAKAAPVGVSEAMRKLYEAVGNKLDWGVLDRDPLFRPFEAVRPEMVALSTGAAILMPREEVAELKAANERLQKDLLEARSAIALADSPLFSYRQMQAREAKSRERAEHWERLWDQMNANFDKSQKQCRDLEQQLAAQRPGGADGDVEKCVGELADICIDKWPTLSFGERWSEEAKKILTRHWPAPPSHAEARDRLVSTDTAMMFMPCVGCHRMIAMAELDMGWCVTCLAAKGEPRAEKTATEIAFSAAPWRFLSGPELRALERIANCTTDHKADVIAIGDALTGTPTPPRAAAESAISDEDLARAMIAVCRALWIKDHALDGLEPEYLADLLAMAAKARALLSRDARPVRAVTAEDIPDYMTTGVGVGFRMPPHVREQLAEHLNARLNAGATEARK